MSAANPYISLGMMLGDAHVGVLERCLRSVLERTGDGGPLVDEIVLGWNGANTVALHEVLEKLGYTLGESSDVRAPRSYVGGGTLASPWPDIKLVPFTWPGRFDTARNVYWPHCKGEWVIWLDADDIVADAGTPAGLAAIERVEKDYGLPPMPAGANTPTTLRMWLSSLPPNVNVIFSPYDYTMDDNDYVQVRQKMKRVVRRSAGHIWHSPEQSGVHEILTCIGGVPEKMAETFGLLIQHYPSQDELARVGRNKEIVDRLTRPGILSDPRHAYDVANAALVAGDMAKANEAISSAIIHAHNDMDRYTYRLARAFIGMQEGNPEKMLQEAFAAIGILPELRDAYFIACDAYYRLGKWLAVIEWFERGVAKTPTLMSRDQPLMQFLAPRAQTALAYTYIGLVEKGIKLIEEMEKEYPLAGLTVEAGIKVRALARQQHGETSLFAALDFMHAVSPNSALLMVQALRRTHALDVLRSTVPWAALERRIADASAPEGLNPEVEGMAKFYDNGLINIDDVLERLPAAAQLLAAEGDPDRRKVKIETRPRATLKPRRIAFYATVGITRWECDQYDKFGMGGSESSVALLARELVDRGHEVTVFTNKPTLPVTSLWKGVIQKDCSQYRPQDWKGDDTVVFCRCPWMAREDPPATKNIYCWHQDNGYANKWMWNEDLLKRQGQLFVSKFAMESLVMDACVAPGDPALRASPVRWAVLGNGILSEVAKSYSEHRIERRPLSVLYASNPSRGLAELLTAWPIVLEKEPTAQLTIACEWNVMLNTTQDEPGLTVGEKLNALQARIFSSPNTQNLGWLPQDKLLDVMRHTAVYAYPGGPMPEGFGVVLVQAEAAGMKMVAPPVGALPEVLDNNTYWLKSREPMEIAGSILRAFWDKEDVRASPPGRHFWPAVADRFLAATAP